MNSQIVTTVYRWLRLMDIHVGKSHLGQRLMSHPDYPSALSITSLLDELGIENGVAQIEESQLNEIQTPFLAFIDGKDFLLITDIRNIEKSIKDFRNRWNGVIIFAERPSAITQSEETCMKKNFTNKNENYQQVPDGQFNTIIFSEEIRRANTSARDLRIKWTIAFSVFILLLGVVLFELSTSNIILFIAASFGLVVSGSIVLRESGVETIVSKGLCGEGETTGCDAMLNTRASTLPLGVKLSDVGVSFFSGMILLSLVSCFAVTDFQRISKLIVGGVCLASVPFTLFSIFYQWKVAKKWCPLCLMVVLILWIMVTLQIPYQFEIKQMDIKSVLGSVSIFMLPGASWLLIRNLLNRENELTNSNIVLQRIYRSSELFETYLLSQEKIEIAPWPFDFQMGNNNASLQIVAVSSHQCGQCAETFEVLQNLLAKLGDQVGITVRFSVKNKEKDGVKASIMRQMFRFALTTENFLQSPQKVAQMLSFWYTVLDLEKFSERYPAGEYVNVEDKMEQQRNWCKLVNIQYTPTIFINGYRLKSPYAQADLLEFGSTLVELFSNAKSEYEVYV